MKKAHLEKELFKTVWIERFGRYIKQTQEKLGFSDEEMSKWLLGEFNITMEQLQSLGSVNVQLPGQTKVSEVRFL